jgi:parvulin-like peptidyl-prolyl isomerase
LDYCLNLEIQGSCNTDKKGVILPKKTVQPKREMTRRQLSHWQRESRIQRIALMAGVLVIVAIVAIVSFGIYANKFKPFREVVIKVGNTQYNMDYYINMLAYYGFLIGNPQNIPYVASQVEQVIGQDKIITDEGAKLGFTISDDEVNKAISDRQIGSDQARKDAVRTELLLAKMKADYFDGQIPNSGPQRQVLAMFLESQAQADSLINDQLNSGADFAQIASDDSLESNSQTKKGDFGWVPQGILSTTIGNAVLENKVFDPATPINTYTTVEDKSYSKNVGYWLVKTTETQTSSTDSSKQYHLFALLVPDEATAKNIKEQLDNGADFVELAKANSRYVSAAENGGDLKFVSKGSMGDAIDAVLFPSDTSKELPLNKVSDPIRDTARSTTGGVWLLKVVATNDDMKIEGDNRSTLITNKLNDWIQTIWTADSGSVQNFLTDTQRQFATTEAQKR